MDFTDLDVDFEDEIPEIEEEPADLPAEAYTDYAIEEGDKPRESGILLEGKDRRSKPVLGLIARTRLLSARVATLKTNPTSKVSLNPGEKWDPLLIAKRELVQLAIPIKIIRKFPAVNRVEYYEVWKITDFKYGIPTTENF